MEQWNTRDSGLSGKNALEVFLVMHGLLVQTKEGFFFFLILALDLY